MQARRFVRLGMATAVSIALLTGSQALVSGPVPAAAPPLGGS
jgi:hypothetical protein